MNVAVEYTLKLPLESNEGLVVVYDVGEDTFKVRPANAKELIEIVEGYRSWIKYREEEER